MNNNLICNTNGLEIHFRPSYYYYTILTNMYYIFWWCDNKKLEIHNLKTSDGKNANGINSLILTLKNQNIYFFGEKSQLEENGIVFYTGNQVNEKIQKLLNLKAFL